MRGSIIADSLSVYEGEGMNSGYCLMYGAIIANLHYC